MIFATIRFTHKSRYSGRRESCMINVSARDMDKLHRLIAENVAYIGREFVEASDIVTSVERIR